jgi:Fe-S-cluster containining protein
LSEEEAEALGARYGRDKRYRTRWGEWRTRVRHGRCVFLVDNACTIHADPHYPAVCRGFPFVDAQTGGPYEYDRTICPEFVQQPELVAIVRRSNGADGAGCKDGESEMRQAKSVKSET